MNPNSLVVTVNTGSTSVKLAAFSTALQQLRIAQHTGTELPAAELLTAFARDLPPQRVHAVAHRVVHGGILFSTPTRIDSAVESAIQTLAELAPLHNPRALRWITATREVFGADCEQVAVFDTAFFIPLPPVAAQYAVSPAFGAEVRRYGFHGIAHEAMWLRWCELNPHLDRGGRLIALQLGGGCSIAAIDRGRPLDTSMGFSPLEGLMMATRSGDVDAAVIPYLERRLKISATDIVECLNRESGLLGVSGITSDMSRLLTDNTPAAQLAVALYCYRARKYVGAYLAVLGGCDGIVFGGGVGEHVPQVREQILDGMQWAGIVLDRDANGCARGGEFKISNSQSQVQLHTLQSGEAPSLARAALQSRSS